MLLEDEVIDVTEVIENNIIIELPIKRLCKENCKGLCQQCGVNLNFSKCKCEKDIDPRLAKLKDFFYSVRRCLQWEIQREKLQRQKEILEKLKLSN